MQLLCKQFKVDAIINNFPNSDIHAMIHFYEKKNNSAANFIKLILSYCHGFVEDVNAKIHENRKFILSQL